MNYHFDSGNSQSSPTEAKESSPIYEQIEILDRRLESTYQEFMTFLQALSPVLTSQEPKEGQTGQIRESGKSPLHDRLIVLNEKASSFARAVSEASRRVTV